MPNPESAVFEDVRSRNEVKRTSGASSKATENVSNEGVGADGSWKNFEVGLLSLLVNLEARRSLEELMLNRNRVGDDTETHLIISPVDLNSNIALSLNWELIPFGISDVDENSNSVLTSLQTIEVGKWIETSVNEFNRAGGSVRKTTVNDELVGTAVREPRRRNGVNTSLISIDEDIEEASVSAEGSGLGLLRIGGIWPGNLKSSSDLKRRCLDNVAISVRNIEEENEGFISISDTNCVLAINVEEDASFVHRTSESSPHKWLVSDGCSREFNVDVVEFSLDTRNA